MAKRNTYFQDEVIEKKFDIRQFRRLLRYVTPHWRTFALVAFLMLISSLAAMISPIMLQRIINQTVVNESYRQLAFLIGAMALLALLEILVSYLHQRIMGKMGHQIIARVRRDLFYHLQELSFDYFDSLPDGKIVVRVTDYINDLANFFTNYLLMLLTYLAKILVVTFFMLGISPVLTGVVFAIVLPMMALIFYLRWKVKKLFSRHLSKGSNRSAFLIESIMGEKVIKAYNKTSDFQDIYADVHHISLVQWMQIVRRNELNSPIVETFWNLGTVALYGTALYLMLRGNATVNAGMVVAFTAYMTQFANPLTQIAFIIQQLAQVTSDLEKVFDTLDTPAKIAEKKDCQPLRNVSGKVDFHHVSFSYEEDEPVLKDFDLHVNPGETIALVGPTGAGKTTVVHLLTRFYDVNSGSVSIDGTDVRDLSLSSLRREVGVLMQDPFLFQGTILENIRYGRLDATDEECIAAAKTIFAHDFIQRLPDGYQHRLSERGGGLSAGEKQLISFARIILKNPSIVILDEATSSIDTETELLIQQALEVLLAHKTAFIVAHRLSTIRNADRILYIANHGIAEEGSHEALMKQKGLYYQLNQ